MSCWISTALLFWGVGIAHLLMLFFQKKNDNFKQTAFSGVKEEKIELKLYYQVYLPCLLTALKYF